MLQSDDLRTELERAGVRLRAASPASAEFRSLSDDLSALGRRITESIEDAFLELTAEQDEAA